MTNKDWVLFWLVGLIWGTSFLWIKIAVNDVSPIMLVSFRTLFGSLGLGLIVALNKQAHVSWKIIKNHWFGFLFMGTINIALPWMLISWAGQFIDSGTSAILNGTMPLFTILLSPIFIKDDRITLPKMAGLLVGFGSVLGNGCTSGHGVCGLARLSMRSLAATLCFMSCAIVTVFVTRHVMGG